MSSLSARLSLPLWSYGELGMSNYYIAKSLYFMVEPKLRSRFGKLKPTTFDSGEPYLGLILSNRRVREVNQRMSSWPAFREGSILSLFLSLFSIVMRPIAPFSPRPAASPSSSASSGSVGSVHRERSRSLRTPVPPMAPVPVPGDA
ncbi:hypothetical protein PIB30_074959 [Stylosanthes scabra]|uniref:Uncharacterized protein n=1 Tax=Stylosanthes scabra TaxID=79078 RepID=A0ABU6RR01_9FABA|nr:hypothetical protein [Stylosanthes scabra]